MSEEIRKYLRQLRRLENLSQTEMGKRLGGLDHAQIGRIERNQRGLSLEEAQAWARACEHRLEFLTSQEAQILEEWRNLPENRKATAGHALAVCCQATPDIWSLFKSFVETSLNRIQPDIVKK
ncbi:MAG: helix-turn-helix transcriptional regulator [Alphaproteobacteria bacterium]|nr:helix-turn-helix transcriptional regulator [Alphaproteobacteria bacterium]